MSEKTATRVTEIVLIRHGQTEWNREVRFRGQADPPLDDVGWRQAAAVARYVGKRWPVEVVYTSPLRRAVQTAKVIGEAQNLTARPFEGLLDIDFGHWQGQSPDEVEQAYPYLLRAWFEMPHTVQIPGGESLYDVQERAVGGLKTVVNRHRGEKVAMVGHTVVNRVLLCAVLSLGNENFWRLRQGTCAVNVFEVDQEHTATIVVLNDTSHLQEIHR